MAIAAVQAAAAYASAARPASFDQAGGGFGAAMTRALESGIQVGRSAEAASTQALMGQGQRHGGGDRHLPR
jgi:flagellar hook-basal body complex protein FliE